MSDISAVLTQFLYSCFWAGMSWHLLFAVEETLSEKIIEIFLPKGGKKGAKHRALVRQWPPFLEGPHSNFEPFRLHLGEKMLYIL